MNHVIVKRLAVVVCILALLVTLPSAALAQEEWDTSIPEVPIEGDPAMYPDVIEADERDEIESADADFVLAQPPYTMNYQGYLTDSAGVPVDGDYDFVARLYDAAGGGTQEWGPENHDDVPVANGLFNLVLGSTTPLHPNDFDEALFLQLTVEGTDLPRQPLRTTAYAFGLVPGAEIQGAPPAGTSYALYVNNTSGDVGLNTPDYIYANGYRSIQDSYVFVPGHVAIPPDEYASTLLTLDPEPGGRTMIKAIAASNSRSIYMPIQTPSMLFGENVTIERIQIYYELSDPNNTYITSVKLEQRNLSDGSLVSMLNSLTDLKGSGIRVATYTPAIGELSSATGPVSLQIVMNFQDTTDEVTIYGVRLKLGHR